MSKIVKFNLAVLRAAKGRLTQRDVALATGLSQKTLSALETGTSKGIEFATLARLCQFFNCTPTDLLLIEDEVEDIKPSTESYAKADKLIAEGIQRATSTPPMTPEEIWDAFDDLRTRIQAQVENAPHKRDIKRRA